MKKSFLLVFVGIALFAAGFLAGARRRPSEYGVMIRISPQGRVDAIENSTRFSVSIPSVVIGVD